jgi:hypothetical protein
MTWGLPMAIQADDVRRLQRLVNVLFVLWLFTVMAFAWIVFARTPGMVTAREFVVLDQHGTARVRIAAPLPEPVTNGKVAKRDDTVSGVMLYDARGNERGGYVTDNSIGNAFLTLDSNNGQDVTLVAYPNGGAELGLNDDEKNKVVIAALGSGPRLRLTRRGTSIFDQPPQANEPTK